MNRKFTIALLVVIVLALAGSIFFFPIRLEGQYTCLYHRMVERDAYAWNALNPHGNTSVLVHFYIHHYSLIWWGSLFILLGTIYWLTQNKFNIKQKRINTKELQ